MNRLGIVLFGVLCVILSYAFSHASEIHCIRIKQGEKVKFAWDEVTKFTNGRDIPSQYRETDAIKYCLYIKNKDEKIKEKDEKEENKFCPETYSVGEIPILIYIFNSPGQYYLGVGAVIDEDKESGIEPSASEISWSYKGTCTNNKPFCVEVQN